ncbi:MAG: hypothetical protein ACK2UW_19610 [Anaerolineales bacterium]|jgi:hypothetical protein
MDKSPELRTGSLVLILAEPVVAREAATLFTAQLALQGPVRVLDGGNRFAAYPLARLVRRYTTELEAVLARVQVARAFTCYQMLALLAQTAELPAPTIVLELLSTFLDESVALIERRYLLRQAVDHLLRLRRQAPLAVTNPPLSAGQPKDLLDMLVEVADRIVRFEGPPPPAAQLRLF